MAVKDVAYNVATFLVSRNHGFTAGLADGLGDVANVGSVGVTAVLTVHNGMSLATVEACGALLVGSVVGGAAGTRLGKALSDRLDQTPKELSGAHD